MPGGSRFTDHAGEPVFILLVTLDAGAGHWTDHAACVWYSQRGGSFRCTGCARQLVAMAADCRHAKAARRAVLAGKVAGVPAPVPR